MDKGRLDALKKSRLFFADPDQQFLKLIKEDPKAKVLPPVCVSTGAEAQAILKDAQNQFSGFFINMKISNPDAVSVLKCAFQNHPTVPLFIIYDENQPFSNKKARELRIQKQIPKPFTYGDLVKEFVPPHLLFDPNEALSTSTDYDTPAGTKVEIDDKDYVPIRANSFLAGSKSFFDVYVKLSDEKFLKLLRAGDEFTSDRLKTFLEKGVSYFFVPRESYDQYVAYCDKVYTALMGAARISNEVKVSQTVMHGERAIDFIRSQETIDESHMQFAASYIQNLWTFLEKIKFLDQSQLAKALINSANTSDHAVSTTVLASILAKGLGFETERSIKIIGLAGLFHDIALITAPREVQDEDEERMTPEQLKIFKMHPTQGGKILEEIRGVDPTVIQTVTQHHRRRDGSGFPNKTGIGIAKMPMTAEIIGICDTYLLLQEKHMSNQSPAFLEELDQVIFSGYTLEIAEKFKAIVLGGK